jgi:hypothetical protein
MFALEAVGKIDHNMPLLTSYFFTFAVRITI